MTMDKWARWLLSRRDGTSEVLQARSAARLEVLRDGVLAGADLQPDDVVLDVGCGTGLVGFGALQRLGPHGRVIFSDVSQDLLDECRRTANGDARCSFVQAAAEDLTGVADTCVDVVTTRSVLMYSDHKATAFAELFRVLRPGGRMSLFEPINRFAAQRRPDDLFGLGSTPVDDLLGKVRDVYRRTTGQAERLLAAFDERDLLDWAVSAGFEAVELEYRAQVDVPAEPIDDWAMLQQVAPNPLVPTYGEAIAAALTAEERDRLDTYMTARAVSGAPTRSTMAVAYVTALRPVT